MTKIIHEHKIRTPNYLSLHLKDLEMSRINLKLNFSLCSSTSSSFHLVWAFPDPTSDESFQSGTIKHSVKAAIRETAINSWSFAEHNADPSDPNQSADLHELNTCPKIMLQKSGKFSQLHIQKWYSHCQSIRLGIKTWTEATTFSHKLAMMGNYICSFETLFKNRVKFLASNLHEID